MDSDKIKEKLTELCKEIFRNFCITPDLLNHADFECDFGMDSIAFITLIVEIENIFCITIPDNLILMENFKNFEKILNVIEEQLSKNIRNEVH